MMVLTLSTWFCILCLSMAEDDDVKALLLLGDVHNNAKGVIKNNIRHICWVEYYFGSSAGEDSAINRGAIETRMTSMKIEKS